MYFDSKKLRNAIARQQISVDAFAKEAGISRCTAYRAVAGGKAYTRSLGKIAAALGVETPTDLCKPQAQTVSM